MAIDILGKRRKQNKSTKGIAKAWLQEKRQEAIARQEAYAQRSVDDVISALNAGNYRAEKQRRKLAARLASEQAVKTARTASKAVKKEKK